LKSVSEQTNNKEKQADKHTRKKQQKLTKKNTTEKHKWKRAECDHVQKKKKRQKNQRSRFLQAHDIKISYTIKDGHVGRIM
jgi:hypothetical protein